jgi:hypothetical protein
MSHNLSVYRMLIRNAAAPVLLTNISRIRKHVQRIFLLVGRPLVEPEQDTSNEREDSDSSVVPHEQRVLRERDESLAKSIGERRHEVPVRSDERSHVLGSLCERELETSDGSENLRETDEDVWHGLGPHVDRRKGVARVHVLAALARRVDEVLDNGCSDHGEGSKDESECHALNGSEPDSSFAQSRVQEFVDDGDEDNEGDRVEIGDNVVGDTVALHGGCLRSEVVVHLVVRQPCKTC